MTAKADIMRLEELSSLPPGVVGAGVEEPPPPSLGGQTYVTLSPNESEISFFAYSQSSHEAIGPYWESSHVAHSRPSGAQIEAS